MAVQHHPGAGIDLRQRVVAQPLAPPQPVGHHPLPARPPDLRLEPGLHRFQHDAAVGARRMAADEDQRDVVGLRGAAARVEMASLRCLRQELRCDAPFGKTPHHQPRAAEHGLVAPEHRHRRQIGRADHPQQVGQSRHRLFQMRAGDMQDDRPSIRSRRHLAPKEQRCLAAGLGADRPGQAFGILGVTPGGLAGPCGVDAQLEEHACAVLHTLLRLRLGHHGADDVPEVVAIVLSGSIARLKQTGHGGCVSGTHKSMKAPRRAPSCFLSQMERAMRFELTTLTLARLCSTPELRPHRLDERGFIKTRRGPQGGKCSPRKISRIFCRGAAGKRWLKRRTNTRGRAASRPCFRPVKSA